EEDEAGSGDRERAGEGSVAEPWRRLALLVGPHGGEQRGAGEERGEGDGGELPVPVDGSAGEVGGVGARGCGDAGAAADSDGGDERRGERDREQREADGALLGERLEVEAVRVAHRLPVGAVAQPVRLERAGAGADERVRAGVGPGGPVELGAPGAGEAEEPLAQ